MTVSQPASEHYLVDLRDRGKLCSVSEVGALPERYKEERTGEQNCEVKYQMLMA